MVHLVKSVIHIEGLFDLFQIQTLFCFVISMLQMQSLDFASIITGRKHVM